jgi:hypothetical protein
MYSGTTVRVEGVQHGVNRLRLSIAPPLSCVGFGRYLASVALVLTLMSGTSFAHDQEKPPVAAKSSVAPVKKRKTVVRKKGASLAQAKRKKPPVKFWAALAQATANTPKTPVKSATSLKQGKKVETPVKFWAALAQTPSKTPPKPGPSLAQGKSKTTTRKTEPTLADRAKQAKADVIAASIEFKASLEKLLAFQQDDLKAASALVEKRKELLAQAVISKKELEESERAVASAQDKVADTKRQLGEADNLIAEATADEHLVKLGVGAYLSTAAMIRYNGPTQWVLSDATKVETFFASKFRHALPISAFGQTAVHSQMGFDHRNAIDVAVSPDSAEGQALMTYLRNAGIPFIAFHYAVAGSATGAHIHIGYPSHRVSK